MLHSVGELLDSHVLVSDGTRGRVLDAFFDERSWEIRFLLMRMEGPGATWEVLCSSEAVTRIDKDSSHVLVAAVPPPDPYTLQQVARLRSSRRMLGSAVAGWTGNLGQAEDAVFEVDSWTLRFLMVDMNSSRVGSLAFIQPDLIDASSWDEQTLRIAVTHVEVLREPDIEIDGEVETVRLPEPLRRSVH